MIVANLLKSSICLVVFFVIPLHGNGGLMPNTDNDADLPAVYEIPGTKWCGPGNTAKNRDDLGRERETDLCCRQHDECPDYIEGGRSKNGLTNHAPYTRFSCPCDREFYDCLKDNVMKNSTSVSGKVGFVYFDVIGTRCYAKDHPIVGCEKYYEYVGKRSLRGWHLAPVERLTKRCRQYKLDETKEPVWQWYDVPSFKFN